MKEQRDEVLEARTRDALESALRDKRIVGGVLRVARDGVLVAQHAVGWRTVNRGDR